MHFLDGADGGEDPEVGEGQPGELLWTERELLAIDYFFLGRLMDVGERRGLCVTWE